MLIKTYTSGSMLIEVHHSGIEISDMRDGVLVHRLYIEFTVEEAKKQFRMDFPIKDGD